MDDILKHIPPMENSTNGHDAFFHGSKHVPAVEDGGSETLASGGDTLV